METFSLERLRELVDRFSQRRILVIGDSVADQFIYGAINRVSREAPVFILRHEQTETIPGGAANCAVNIASLGGHVSLISLTGDDDSGSALRQKLSNAGVDCSGTVSSPEFRTTTKVRILAGQTHSTRQQVIRLDYEGDSLNEGHLKDQLYESIFKKAKECEAIVLSDYSYGVADPATASVLRQAIKPRDIPVLVDSRFRLSSFSNFTSATPNEAEVEQMLGEAINETALENAGASIRSELGYQSLLITRGGKGMLLLQEGIAPFHLEAVGSREPVDVTGAGDTVMATYALAIASGASFSEAAVLANHAGGIVVMKRGTAAVNKDELENSLLHG